MAGRRGCVNSLWSGTERVRIGERLKATLAGVMELELLRCKHLEMVDNALEDRTSSTSSTAAAERGSGAPERSTTAGEEEEAAAGDLCAATSRQQVSDGVWGVEE